MKSFLLALSLSLFAVNSQVQAHDCDLPVLRSVVRAPVVVAARTVEVTANTVRVAVRVPVVVATRTVRGVVRVVDTVRPVRRVLRGSALVVRGLFCSFR